MRGNEQPECYKHTLLLYEFYSFSLCLFISVQRGDFWDVLFCDEERYYLSIMGVCTLQLSFYYCRIVYLHTYTRCFVLFHSICAISRSWIAAGGMTQFHIPAINIYLSMARQSEKESAEKYALESLKIFIWWLREKGERVEEHIYMDGSEGEQHFEEGNFQFQNCLTLRQLSYDSCVECLVLLKCLPRCSNLIWDTS